MKKFVHTNNEENFTNFMQNARSPTKFVVVVVLKPINLRDNIISFGAD